MPFDSEIPARSRDMIVLEKARERIAQGWCQATYGKDAKVCLLGALNFAVTGRADEDQYARLLGFRTRGWKTAGTVAFEWNDATGRTQAEVLARFDAAIAKLEKNDGE